MKKDNAIIIGILILIAAVGLLFYAFMPGLAIFTVPLWKWFLTGAIVYWLIKKVVFGKSLAYRLSIFIPLALAFMLFEKEIGALIGKGDDFVHNGLIILAAAMIDAAIMIIFRSKDKKFFSESSTGGSETVTYGNADTGSDPITFKLGDHVYYADASVQKNVNLINKLGGLNIYYQNTDTGDTSETLRLNVSNQMGETRIHVPQDWHVEFSADNSMGEVHCRPNSDITGRTIVIRVKNQMGEVRVLSDS